MPVILQTGMTGEYHSAMRKPSLRQYNVVIEQDEVGYCVASIPELPGCHTQARSLDKLVDRIREAIELYVEVAGERFAVRIVCFA